mgnify:CR=1 FL=1
MRNSIGRLGAIASLIAVAGCGSEGASPPANALATDDTGSSNEADSGGAKANVNVKETVAIASGKIVGEADGDVLAFRGVPYAAPPVGELRWKPPAPAAKWDVARDAKQFASECVQQAGDGSEDCLYLNVWAHKGKHAPRPVMLFIHGGGFIEGSSSEAFYAGGPLAADADAVQEFETTPETPSLPLALQVLQVHERLSGL